MRQARNGKDNPSAALVKLQAAHDHLASKYVIDGNRKDPPLNPCQPEIQRRVRVPTTGIPILKFNGRKRYRFARVFSH